MLDALCYLIAIHMRYLEVVNMPCYYYLFAIYHLVERGALHTVHRLEESLRCDGLRTSPSDNLRVQGRAKHAASTHIFWDNSVIVCRLGRYYGTPFQSS